MPSFGDMLRREREARGVPIEKIAEETGVDRSHLEALEREDFSALPGRAFGKFFIRLYGEVLGFDAQPLIAEYDRAYPLPLERNAEPARPERAESHRVESAIQEWRQSLQAQRGARVPAAAEAPVQDTAVDAPGSPAESVPDDPALRVRRRRGRLVLLVLAVASVGVGAWILYSISGGSPETSREPTPAATAPTEIPSSHPAPMLHAETPPATPPPPTSHLTVLEAGFGRRVADHRLEGEGRRFESGTVVWFLTRVRGGRPGDTVRHVWTHRGRSEQSIELSLGGPDWRTYSRRRVRETGSWTVEVRDREDRLLARESFDCEQVTN